MAPPRIITCKDNKMISINLPHSNIKIGGTRKKPTVLDILRHRYVTLTPEEWVRQNFVHYLISELHYPLGLLANEVSLPVGTKRLRADSVLYDRDMHPRMIIATMKIRLRRASMTRHITMERISRKGARTVMRRIC